ncbi:hypothetical protein ACFQ48_12060 [Hymenobacter caeli]|uniref:Uncharacterized protein n=1 Tax=Hymenobacter caeli TaxID=2735894 RepID=A0ABX2FMM5_9BACT|nr:hypothetical protein [Hymenobacter caeli]NRT18418.1 hypothetical protein [Hymenobacter caeli]
MVTYDRGGGNLVLEEAFDYKKSLQIKTALLDYNKDAGEAVAEAVGCAVSIGFNKFGKAKRVNEVINELTGISVANGTGASISGTVKQMRDEDSG